MLLLLLLLLLQQCTSFSSNNNIRRRTTAIRHQISLSSQLGFQSLSSQDGHLKISSIIKSVPNEVTATLLSSKLKNILLPNLENAKPFLVVLKELRNVVAITDAIIMIMLILGHKYALKSLYSLTYKIKDGYRGDYKDSFWGQIEAAVTYSSWFLPSVYLLDIITIILQGFGYDFHIKGDIPRLICTIGTTIMYGMFLTRIKDWAVNKFIRKNFFTDIKRDPVREATVNELSSTVIWLLLGGFCLEAMSLELGFGLGSIYAAGGLGSASLVLALRTTVENFIGGILVKVQDKFRVGELITIPKSIDRGIVESINYAETRMRLSDDSVVLIPNNVFSKMEIINWSRTPYRLFKTTVVLSIADLQGLPKLVNDINDRIRKVEGVEIEKRDLLVSAGGFKEGKIFIDIETHLEAVTEVEASTIKTNVVSEISDALKSAGVKM